MAINSKIPETVSLIKTKIGGKAIYIWLALFMTFSLPFLTTFPPINYVGDEIGNLSYGSRFMKSSLAGEITGDIVNPRIYFAALWLFLATLGTGFFQARLLSLLCAIFVLYMAYRVGREMGGERAGLISSVLLGCSFAFCWHSRVARPEMMSSAFVMGAFYALYYAYRHAEATRFLFYSGLAVVLSVSVHPSNFSYILSFILFYAVLFRKRLLSAATLHFACGLAAGLICWLAIVYLPFYYVNHLSASAGAKPLKLINTLPAIVSTSSVPVLRDNFFFLIKDILQSLPGDMTVKYVKIFNSAYTNNISLAFYMSVTLVILVLSLFTRQRNNVLLLMLFAAATVFLIYLVVITHFGFWHMVEFYPFISVAAAMGIYGLSERFKKKFQAILLWGLTAVFLAVKIADIGYESFSMKSYDYQRLLRQVSMYIPQGAKVFAHEIYSPVFRENIVGYSYNVDYPFTTCDPFKDVLKNSRAEYFVFDDALRGMMRTSCGVIYENRAAKHLVENGKLIKLVNENYPNRWASGKMIRDIYIVRIINSE